MSAIVKETKCKIRTLLIYCTYHTQDRKAQIQLTHHIHMGLFLVQAFFLSAGFSNDRNPPHNWSTASGTDKPVLYHEKENYETAYSIHTGGTIWIRQHQFQLIRDWAAHWMERRLTLDYNRAVCHGNRLDQESKNILII